MICRLDDLECFPLCNYHHVRFASQTRHFHCLFTVKEMLLREMVTLLVTQIHSSSLVTKTQKMGKITYFKRRYFRRKDPVNTVKMSRAMLKS